LGSALALHTEPDLAALGGHASTSNMLVEYGALAAHVMVR
jgi:hypothetical protein